LKSEKIEGSTANVKIFSLESNSDDEQPDPSSRSWEPSTTSFWLTGRYVFTKGSLIFKGLKVRDIMSAQGKGRSTGFTSSRSKVGGLMQVRSEGNLRNNRERIGIKGTSCGDVETKR
jgi:hypothetical protein